MSTQDDMKSKWMATRDRLVAKGLLGDVDDSLSVRCPTAGLMWLGAVADAEPVLMQWKGSTASETAALHAEVYASRTDVGAIAWGGGPFGACLTDFGGLLPQVFDEQARHIGPMAPAVSQYADIGSALHKGGNALIWRGLPLCLGTTCTRMALNAELFEKCAKAYVLATATGGRVRRLPWLVRYIANSRLYKDERRATEAFGRGELPIESRGY
jgi:ribulose-5-phosphate 4-epimerase/fuculose-1-phosphate aldolase